MASARQSIAAPAGTPSRPTARTCCAAASGSGADEAGDELAADVLELGRRQDPRTAWMWLGLDQRGGRQLGEDALEHRDLVAQRAAAVGLGVRVWLVR